MKRPTEAMGNSLDFAVFGSDIKGPTCPDQDTPNVDPLLGPTGDNRSDHIPRLEPFDFFGPLCFGAGEADGIDIGHASASIARRCYEQGNDSLELDRFWGTLA